MEVAPMTVLMPWRDSGCPYRTAAKDFLTRHYGPIGPVITADSGHDPFHRAASRNLAARLTDADVLVFLDADAYVPLRQVEEAVEVARRVDVLVKPYSRAGYLTEQASETLVQGSPAPTFAAESWIHPPMDGFVGLAWVIRRDLFERLGGFDEGFVGYGGEDNAFAHACHVLLGSTRHVAGMGASLWHPMERITPQANLDRLDRYGQVRSWDDYWKVKA